jgi:hypothetical protein
MSLKSYHNEFQFWRNPTDEGVGLDLKRKKEIKQLDKLEIIEKMRVRMKEDY